MSEENKAVILRFGEEVLNGKNLDRIDDLFAPEFVDRLPIISGIPLNREGLKMALDVVFSAFPDMRFHVGELVAEGDKVVARWEAHGTHQGELAGIPPSGKEVSFPATVVYRIANGKITDRWEILDMMGLMQQLGAIPSPGGGITNPRRE